MYVQYGSGWLSAPEGWVNFDASFALRWERTPLIGRLYTKNSQRFPTSVRFGDIVAGLPVKESSCRGVYASHVLEHLSLTEFHLALENTKKILADGGIFRAIVPDLEWSAREYLSRIGSGSPDANKFFLQSTGLGLETRDRGLVKFVYSWLQTCRHYWMWDSASLINALREHGFRDVRNCSFGDCEDRMFSVVEDQGRFEQAVAIEARR